MNIKRTFILLAVVALAGTLKAVAQDFFLHTVEKGQGLYSISRTYGVTEEDIIKLNPGSEKKIIAGDALKIPRRSSDGSRTFHTVAAGETLFGLASSNNVTIKQICDANPGLSVETLKAGMVIAIPKADAPASAGMKPEPEEAPAPLSVAKIQERDEFKSRIEIRKKVTVYRLCKDFDITEEEFLAANPRYRSERLRQGDVVNIPFNAREIEQREEEFRRQNMALEEEQKRKAAIRKDSVSDSRRNQVNAALILPLQLDIENSSERAKMLEFTRGALLAVDRLKDEGISVNLKIIDSGDEHSSIDSILEKLDNIDIVIGPKGAGQISEAALWSYLNEIPLVLPFNKNADEVFSNPHIFQLNTPQSYFTQDITDHFARQFKNPNIIVLESGEGGNSLIESLENLATENNFPIQKLRVDTAAQIVMEHLDNTRQNVFVIDSPESGPLLTMLPVLQLINRTKDPETRCCLFGYPEYQIYAADLLDQLCECDTWFYSWFYTNNMLQESIDFGNSFIRSFGRQMMVSYPSYAPYGYDTALYFLKGVAKYGKDFENSLDRIDTDPVQMGFKFSRSSNWGGFINRKVFFVHFSNEFMVEKIDFDK